LLNSNAERLRGERYFSLEDTEVMNNMQPASFSIELKQKIASLFSRESKTLEDLDPAALESFASELLKMIEQEKGEDRFSHDLQVLENSMKHLKKDASILRVSAPGTDEYDFARNDCRGLIESTRKWLELEGLI